MNSTFAIVLGCIGLVAAVTLFVIYTIRITNEEKESRFPGPDDIVISKDDIDYFPQKGDFYIRDSRNDLNPFEMYNIYRIDDIRQNIYGTYWVKYTAPGFGSDYTPKWKELESPLESFLNGKVRVEKIKKNKKWNLKTQS